ncbi:MAG TPA: hypothetical protein VGO21_05215, partial [Candidatus Paceibacterota bacterium]|nr:hypothetical protein [Candidatus Paceibacterota bacterium]
MEKIKQFIESEKGKDILIVIIVILVGLGSFELGRLSKENNNSGIKIEYPNPNKTQGANVVSSINPSGPAVGFDTKATQITTAGKNYFASSRGSKYYSIG